MVTPDINRQEIDNQSLNCDIIFDEVRQSTISANRGKALRDDGIPIEVLNNRNCIVYLTRLFNNRSVSGHQQSQSCGHVVL